MTRCTKRTPAALAGALIALLLFTAAAPAAGTDRELSAYRALTIICSVAALGNCVVGIWYMRKRSPSLDTALAGFASKEELRRYVSREEFSGRLQSLEGKSTEHRRELREEMAGCRRDIKALSDTVSVSLQSVQRVLGELRGRLDAEG